MNAFAMDRSVSPARLVLPDELTIECAAGLRAALHPLVAAQHAVCIDVGALARIDAAGLQVLLAAARATRLELANAEAPGWTGALERYGLTTVFAETCHSNPTTL